MRSLLGGCRPRRERLAKGHEERIRKDSRACRGQVIEDTFTCRSNVKEVKEGVERVRIVSAEWLETVLPMHEYDCVAMLEKVFCRGGASSS